MERCSRMHGARALGGLSVEVVNNTIVGNAVGLDAPVDGIAVHNNVIAGNDLDVSLPGDASRVSVRSNLFGASMTFVGQDGTVTVHEPSMVQEIDLEQEEGSRFPWRNERIVCSAPSVDGDRPRAATRSLF